MWHVLPAPTSCGGMAAAAALKPQRAMPRRIPTRLLCLAARHSAGFAMRRPTPVTCSAAASTARARLRRRAMDGAPSGEGGETRGLASRRAMRCASGPKRGRKREAARPPGTAAEPATTGCSKSSEKVGGCTEATAPAATLRTAPGAASTAVKGSSACCCEGRAAGCGGCEAAEAEVTGHRSAV